MKKNLLFFLFLFFLSSFALAEPWLSTRFSQNCAACHAPGRKNLKPIDRRCSLSCQGCHVNPNGGGLRSHYGKWNENRWLRTLYDDNIHKKAVAPYNKQRYSVASKKGMDGGFPLVERWAPSRDKDYKRSGNENQTAFNNQEKLYMIPQGDPYRTMFESKVDGGADFRILGYQPLSDDPTAEGQSFFMSADFGFRYRPFYKNVHLVYETRFLGSPNVGYDIDQAIGTERTRSLYLLLDDMPWNIFAMAGYYRPLFGNMSPDHTALREVMTATALTELPRSQTLVYQATSIGTAPNVPYANLHFIGKRKYTVEGEAETQGMAINVGLRGVTRGQSLNYSYWNSEDKISNTVMHSVSAAIQLWRSSITGELLILERDTYTEYRKANLFTIDTQTRLWVENYVTFSLARATTAPDLRPGSATQIKTGVRSFLIPGVDVSLIYDMNKVETEDGITNDNRIVWQIHTYF